MEQKYIIWLEGLKVIWIMVCKDKKIKLPITFIKIY